MYSTICLAVRKMKQLKFYTITSRDLTKFLVRVKFHIFHTLQKFREN